MNYGYHGLAGWLQGSDSGDRTLPLECDYCGRVDRTGASNCPSCGGPMPIPEVVEQIVEREYRVTLELLDCTSMADTNAVYIQGKRDERVRETVVRQERIK